MNKIVLSILISLMGVAVHAQTAYHINYIPAALLEKADAVVRQKDGQFEIKAIDQGVYSYKKVVTILNRDASEQAELILYYDDLVKIKALKAAVYDQYGRLVKKYKEKDFKDYSAISGNNLYDGSRVKFINLKQDKYPYTVEFEFEMEYDYLYGIPDWQAIQNYNASLISSNFTLIYPQELRPRYALKNTDKQPTITKTDGLETLSWNFENISGFDYEIYSAGLNDLSPIIKAAPTKFKFDDYEGDMSKWEGFGQWQNKLNEDLKPVPEDVVRKVQELIAPLNSNKEKAAAIYSYMQNNTRYVSIQLGIGGFKPFSPAYVAENGYGDCKALSFYTKKLLEIGGIQANYSWISAGRKHEEIDRDFPNDNFNHIILNVPLEKDTMWLECTDQTLPAGYLGSFTADRYALVMTDDGHAQLIKTPIYEGERNKITIKVEVAMKADNNAVGNMAATLIGVGSEYNDIDYYIKKSDKEKEDWLRTFIGMPDFSINSYAMKATKDSIPKINVESRISIRSFSSQVAGRVLINPIVFNGLGKNIARDDERKSPIYLKDDRTYEIQSVIHLPKGYKIDKPLEDELINSAFGQYSIAYVYEANKVTCTRNRKLNSETFSKESFNDFRDFMKEIRAIEGRRLVLTKAD